MIRQCTANDKADILEYIGPNYGECLYLYLDLLRYGVESSTVSVYVVTDGEEINAVLLEYYSCLHIFSKKMDLEVGEIVSFIKESDYSMIYCTRTLADALFSQLSDLPDKNVSLTRGWVAQIQKVNYAGITNSGEIVLASEEDFLAIAELIFGDEDIGRSYEFERLTKQLIERNHQGYSRNLVIKDGNRIVAHACTNAETDTIAVVAELIVREEYRGLGYATQIWSFLCNCLLKEKKEVYSIYYSEKSRRLHKKLGFDEICEWEKIVII